MCVESGNDNDHAACTLCLAENGPCSQQCTVVAGRARCSCFTGFSLMTDGRMCEGKSVRSFLSWYLLAVIGAIDNAHVYPLSSLPQAGFAQGNKQPHTINNSNCCTTTKHIEPCQQNKSAMEPFVQRWGHFFNWMQSLMKEENAGLMMLNNASTDWAPTSWMPLPGALVNLSQLPCGSWRCNNKQIQTT